MTIFFLTSCTKDLGIIKSPAGKTAAKEDEDDLDCRMKEPRYDFGIWGSGYYNMSRVKQSEYMGCMNDKGYTIGEPE